ncbi:MAG: CHRD domain-containing protein [Rubrivivax sp.]
MSKIRHLIPTARAGLLALAVISPLAIAGHLNTLLNADLDGRQEVNATGNNAIVGDPNGRGEFYVFAIDSVKGVTENSRVLCYNLQVKRIGELELAPGDGRAAHIHKGKAGENGPVVAGLAWPQDGQAADCLDARVRPAQFPLGDAVVADILANPQDYYVNVHNAEYPGGAIRGQLRVAKF